MTPHELEDIYRAATALSRDRATDEVLRRMEQTYIEKWKMSPPDRGDERDDAYRMVRAIGEFRNELTALAAEPSVTAFNRRLKRGP